MKKLATFMVSLVLAGCSMANANDGFKGRTYRLLKAPNDAQITIAFDANEPRFAGLAAVNRYFGSYGFDSAGRLELSPAGTTMMMGPMPLMEAEQEYLKILPTVSGFELKGQTLILKTSGGQDLIFIETIPDADN